MPWCQVPAHHQESFSKDEWFIRNLGLPSSKDDFGFELNISDE